MVRGARVAMGIGLLERGPLASIHGSCTRHLCTSYTRLVLLFGFYSPVCMGGNYCSEGFRNQFTTIQCWSWAFVVA